MSEHVNEYAAGTHAHSAPPEGLSAAHRSLARFKEALAKAGGRARAGRNGPMTWNETRGWFDREARCPSPVQARPAPDSGRGRTLAALEARQRDVARELFEIQLRRDEALITGASPMAWLYARQFAAGLGGLSWGASADERAGWALHRLGFARPPLRVLRRQLAKSMS